MRLKDKIAIVTGAGSGIGRGIALAFVKEGAKVVVADWSEKGGEETVKLIKKEKGEVAFVKVDVSKAADIDKMVKTCVDKFGKLDILVNNAGIFKTAGLLDFKEEDWDKVINVNLKSIFLGCKAAIPLMLKQDKGKIINMASIAGIVGFMGASAYCASKGGMITLTKEMALEFAPKKININCICPGVIKTAMTDPMLKDKATKDMLKQNTPYPRFGQPEDIASAAVYLASDESDFINGAIFVIDGGWISH